MNSRKLLCTTLVLGGLHGAPALADTSYPGTLCHPDNPTDRQYVHREARGAFARGKSGVAISCPIVRDITQDKDGLRQLRIYVIGYANCTLNGRDFEGDIRGGSDYRDGAVHRGSGEGTLYLSTRKSYGGGPYEFGCILGRDAGVTGYFVDE